MISEMLTLLAWFEFGRAKVWWKLSVSFLGYFL